jgi:hypothetical protein
MLLLQSGKSILLTRVFDYIEEYMIDLIPRLRSHFDPMQSRFKCFLNEGVQLEGWFKGEMLFVLDQIKSERGKANFDFDREVKFEKSGAKKRIDIKITICGLTHWVELKYWLIGEQKGKNGPVQYGPSFYFTDKYVGIDKEIKALQQIPEDEVGWILILAVDCPVPDKWKEAVEKSNYGNILKPGSSPSEFRESGYFLGLLEVENISNNQDVR